MILTGHDAIDYAAQAQQLLNKYMDPIEDDRTGLDLDEARAIADEDPSLIWIVVPDPVASDVVSSGVQAGAERDDCDECGGLGYTVGLLVRGTRGAGGTRQVHPCETCALTIWAREIFEMMSQDDLECWEAQRAQWRDGISMMVWPEETEETPENLSVIMSAIDGWII